MKEMSILNHPQFGEVRSVKIKNEPWFVAKDVCQILGDSHYRRTMAELDSDERVLHKIYTLGGIQEMVLINESGFYHLLFLYQPLKGNGKEMASERNEFLKSFRRWVTGEVLPQIRKYGYYINPNANLSKKELAKLNKRMLAFLDEYIGSDDIRKCATKMAVSKDFVSNVLTGYNKDSRIMADLQERAIKNKECRISNAYSTDRMKEVIDQLTK